MHLIQLYALASSSTIAKPQITLKYFPLSINKYITLHTTSKETKSYSYWQEVVNLILPTLQKEGISIIQIGQKEETPIQGCIHLLGQTSINQCCYVLNNTLLHMGADSFPVHFCSSISKKIVALYSNNFISNVGPYWSWPEDVILLEPQRKNGEKPSFMVQGEKSINNICLIEIAQSVLKLLNLPFNLEYKTLLIGNNYQNRIIELIPDVVVDTNKLGVGVLPIRMDYLYNLDNLFKQTQICKTVIITDKIIPIEPLIQLRGNIQEILYKITPEHNPEFVKSLQQAKIPFKLWSELKDEDLNPIKLDYMDFGIIYRKNTEMPEILKNKDLGRIAYKSSKHLLSNGKIFNSFWDFKADRHSPDFNGTILPIMDVNLNELFVDVDNLYFLEKIEEKT